MDNTVPSNADLMAHLTQLMKDVMVRTGSRRILLNTRTAYQSEGGERATPPTRRISASQDRSCAACAPRRSGTRC